MAQQNTTKWDEIRNIHKEYKFFYQIGSGAILLIVGVLIGATVFAGDIGYPTNLYTELLSIVVTVFILDLLARRRDEARLKEQLVRQVGSRDNGLALQAFGELEAHHWVEDGSLRGKIFAHADWSGVSLHLAPLQGIVFLHSNLSDAHLERVQLQRSFMFQTSLKGASLLGCDFEGSKLGGIDLQGADMHSANLRNVQLIAVLDEKTKLPDGTFWTEETDMKQFTNPDHSNFWRGLEFELAADLRDSDFHGTNLRGAYIWGVNLSKANLREANLQAADFESSNLAGTDFSGANLFEAKFSNTNLSDAQFDEQTILPDGTKWTTETDVEQFVKRSYEE